MKEFNFIANIEGRDKELFFGPLTVDDTFIDIESTWTMAHIVLIAGIFKTLTQARKNGFNGQIPWGFTDRHIGKLKTRITILNFKENHKG